LLNLYILLNSKLKWTHTLHILCINRIDMHLINSSFTRFETTKLVCKLNRSTTWAYQVNRLTSSVFPLFLLCFVFLSGLLFSLFSLSFSLLVSFLLVLRRDVCNRDWGETTAVAHGGCCSSHWNLCCHHWKEKAATRNVGV